MSNFGEVNSGWKCFLDTNRMIPVREKIAVKTKNNQHTGQICTENILGKIVILFSIIKDK